ncbi:uncharacterized protein LOC141685542 [Apium graveolens]|uniref:uncharacterized protein LOC141685542 n=1 Tax=Apium graveolens TaxID=4045 RepID=UPI003D793C38
MAIITWNARGLNGEEAIRQAKLLVKYHKPNLLFLMETKLADGKVNIICNKLGFEHGFEVPRTGFGGGLMVLWKDNVEVTYLSSSPNHFSCFLRLDNQARAWHFCGFYGEPKVANRHYTWNLLQKLRYTTTGPWLVMGDFNEILSQDDKDGGGVKSEAQIKAFQLSREACDIQPLDYKGDHYTWVSKTDDGSLKERLDWAMVNKEWVEWFPDNHLVHLDFFQSDHRALYVGFQDGSNLSKLSRRRARFRFENMWISEPDCQEIIKSN